MATSIASPPPPVPKQTTETSPPAPPQTAADPPNDPASSHPPAPLKTSADPPPEPTLLTNALSELKSLTSAATAFQQCYDDLLRHLHSIRSSIATILPSKGSQISDSSSPQQIHNPDRLSSENPSQKGHDQRNSEIVSLNKAICGRNMRKYIMTHLNDAQKLREEVPHSLKLAADPFKLVLDSLGKFYLQGKKAFERDSPMINSREASIFMLECFLLMMGLDETEVSIDVERSVRDESEAVAVVWKKRLVAEGGIAKASGADARGLLLFVACFGVPAAFRRFDVRDLAVAGNGKEIAGLLRKSRKFVDKMIEIVEELLKIKMDVDAVDMIYTFGLEEKFNPRTILLNYLRESKASWTSPKQAAPIEGKRKKLAVLKSIRKCLDRHKIDPAKVLPGWQVREHIEKLEKTVAESDMKNKKKASEKRKSSGIEQSSKKPRPQNPLWSVRVGHVPLLPQQPKHTSHVINYSAPPSIAYGEPGTSSLQPSVAPSSSNHANVYSSIVYGDSGAGPLQAGVVPLSSDHANVYSTANYYGGVSSVNVSEQGVSQGHYPYHQWQGDGSLAENYAYAGQSSSSGVTGLFPAPASMEGFGGVANNAAASSALGSDPYQFANAVAGIEQRPSNSSFAAHYPYVYQV